jgi:hypothetical protein
VRGAVSAETSDAFWFSPEAALDLPFTESMVIPRYKVGCGRRSAVLHHRRAPLLSNPLLEKYPVEVEWRFQRA